MRNLILVLVVCALGGFYRFAAPGSAITESDLRVIAKSVQIQADRRYCPMNYDEANKDDIAHLLISDAIGRGYDQRQLQGKTTLEHIEYVAEKILASLKGRCSRESRMSVVAPLKFDPLKRDKNAHELALEKRKQSERLNTAIGFAAAKAEPIPEEGPE